VWARDIMRRMGSREKKYMLVGARRIWKAIRQYFRVCIRECFQRRLACELVGWRDRSVLTVGGTIQSSNTKLKGKLACSLLKLGHTSPDLRHQNLSFSDLSILGFAPGPPDPPWHPKFSGFQPQAESYIIGFLGSETFRLCWVSSLQMGSCWEEWIGASLTLLLESTHSFHSLWINF
jgi:hypothetical protein